MKLSQVYEDKIYINPYIKLLEETPDFDQKDNKADYGIICVKSLIWPGAYNFYFGKENYFFYFSNGFKFIDTDKEGTLISMIYLMNLNLLFLLKILMKKEKKMKEWKKIKKKMSNSLFKFKCFTIFLH